MDKQLKLSELKKGARIHFIGIGGISMSGLALVMLKRGFKVSGSDRSKSHITDKLEEKGAVIWEGHKAEQVHGADLVVHTAAVHEDNPEMAEAKKMGIQLIDRAECLGAVMREYKNAVGVSGTHGKTTTTSMLAHALINADADPTISLGGELDLIDGNIRVGNSDCFVTEACEYTNSFLKFFPSIALITNIEEDHLDFFSGIEEIRQSFRKFAGLTKGKGSVVAWGEDENVRKALDGLDCDIHYYGLSDSFEYHADPEFKGGFPCFDVYRGDEFLCHLDMNVPGKHNVLNAIATIAVCDLMNIDIKKAAEGIENFTGTHRRFERKGEINGAVVIDDYAHHPTEIKATLEAAKAVPHKKLWCVFQPHTYTRTRTLWSDFVRAFDDVDELILVDIYAAREVYDGKTSSSDLARDIRGRGINAVYCESFEKAEKILKNSLQEGDILFTMGAGNVVKIGEDLVR